MSQVAIFSIDPGGHTGIAWAVLDLSSETAAEAMRNRTHSGSDTVEGDELGQAWFLMEKWKEFHHSLLGNAKIATVTIMEDYVIRPGHAPGREALSPLRVGWSFLGMLAAERGVQAALNVVLRQPAQAMSYNNQKFLKGKWGAWIVGRPHERAAFAHLGSWAKDNMI